ncbi:MAG: spermidine/putrescine ABC transporter permease PotC [Alphaproteobacteria bacterium]|nr:spermidine/putrescine ABC transporter permease PotC [Alphaproteobacteria bacterium]MBO4643222.1 spermidine/putrescine ABC transporter permease PotC [Alphaproteobacteria bacterium]
MVGRFFKYLYVSAVYLLLYVPLLVTIVFSFNDSASADTWNGFTMQWYKQLFADKSLINSAFRSLFLAAAAATCSTVIGTVIAVALHRYRFIGQKVVYGSLSVIMLSPEIIQGISLVVIFVILGIPLGFSTLLLSHTVFCFPFVTITILARLKGVSRDLAEAAADLGASDVDTVRFILIPLIVPAVFAGWLMSFTLSIDDVIISFFVGGKNYEILPLKIYSMVRTGIQPDVNALCAAMFFATFFVVMFSYRLVRTKK